MVAGGIAFRFDAPIWFDKPGNTVEEEEEAFGLKSSIHPDKLLSSFTVTEFTIASGEAVMASISFAAKEVHPLWIQGFDSFSYWIGYDFDQEKPHSKGRQLLQAAQ